jgi:hypothetical protein
MKPILNAHMITKISNNYFFFYKIIVYDENTCGNLYEYSNDIKLKIFINSDSIILNLNKSIYKLLFIYLKASPSLLVQYLHKKN